jgi:electron transfer flavoprotein alpha subunit
VTAARTLRVAAVLDATGPSAQRHARALAGFLGEGLELADGAELDAVTHVLAGTDAHDEQMLAAPTGEVWLARVPPHRPDLAAATLTALHASGGVDVYVFPAGPSGVELAARLAARVGGSVLTDVLSASFAGDGMTCRRSSFAGHLVGDVVLGTRPWCLVLDASWDETRVVPPKEHVVGFTTQAVEDDATAPPLLDIEQLELPPTGDLEAAKFLVVAGRGAGSRGGVARIAAAAARMGAAFGVTRPVVMSAWADPDRQVGVSGTRTAPDVCIVAGASGAPAFVWGVERAGFIAAVDTDDHAPIAGEADAFVAGDAVAVLEALAGLVRPVEDG